MLEKIKLHIAETLKRLRTEKKITQKELGDFLGVQNSTISAWELGQNSIDISVLFRICNYLGVSISEFDPPDENKKTFDMSLSEVEKKLILDFRKLSNDAKDKVLGIIEILR